MTTPVLDNAEESTQSIPVKTKLKDYRQKLMTVKARIRIVNTRSKASENISKMEPFRKE